MAVQRTSRDVRQIAEGLGTSGKHVDDLVPLVYDELRRVAARYLRRESPGNTLQPTALVHEAFLKLAQQQRVDWQGRTHVLAIGAKAMRRILVDHAKRKRRVKHGGGLKRIELDEATALSPQRDADLLAVDEALEKLAQIDQRQATIVELRFFGGMTVEEVAEALGVSKRTVEAEWTMVRAWLRRELEKDHDA
jgi:RNA polymerase sigma-70 factor (ECF subfamily)